MIYIDIKHLKSNQNNVKIDKNIVYNNYKDMKEKYNSLLNEINIINYHISKLTNLQSKFQENEMKIFVEREVSINHITTLFSGILKFISAVTILLNFYPGIQLKNIIVFLIASLGLTTLVPLFEILDYQRRVSEETEFLRNNSYLELFLELNKYENKKEKLTIELDSMKEKLNELKKSSDETRENISTKQHKVIIKNDEINHQLNEEKLNYLSTPEEDKENSTTKSKVKIKFRI